MRRLNQMNVHPANAAFHALNKAVQPPEPSIEEILAEHRLDLQDAEYELFIAERASDPWKWATKREAAQRRIAALRRHIKALEGSF
jgi:hypothetical protein